MADKSKDKTAVDPLASYPSVGRILHVPVDEKPGPAGNPTQFSRPLIVTSVGDHQLVSGFLFLEPQDTYKGTRGPVALFVADLKDWHWPNTQQPYAGR